MSTFTSASRAFQFTLPHGERRHSTRKTTISGMFQFTLPHGERPCPAAVCQGSRRVSIHAPAWGATRRSVSTIVLIEVSIHAPAWGATWDRPPRYSGRCVSIHAPAWGATARCRNDHLFPMVSIHAPAWGATSRRWHRRRDGRVSIHAPAWGATRVALSFLPMLMFQFTLPHGERLASSHEPTTIRLFQFTLPHGERLCRIACFGLIGSFNSRSRMGSDLTNDPDGRTDYCFNSRSRMGSDSRDR